MAQARHIVETGLDLYAGDDNILQPFLELGGVGGICVHTHVVGPQVAEQVRAVREGDVERAREIDRELEPAYELLRSSRTRSRSRPRSTCSATTSGTCRLPLVPPTEAELARSATALSRLGLLVAA